jgi:hypothetical protein
MSTAGSPTSVALEPNIRRPKAPRMTSVRCRASTSGGGPGQTVAIIGRGRVGLAIGRMCERLDMEHVFMTRGDTSFPPHGPIYVATHASDLDDVLALVPNDRRKDLVLLQGGLLRDDWLRHRGLNRSCAATQVALYMSAKGDGTVRDGGGATCACGPRAGDVSELLTKGGERSVRRRRRSRVSSRERLQARVDLRVLAAVPIAVHNAGRRDDGRGGGGLG